MQFYAFNTSINASNVANATIIVLVGGWTTQNVSATIYLGEGGSISGRVTNASNGSAISDKEVRAYSGDKVVKSAITDSNGYYILTGIEPGIYQVRPYPVSGQIVNQQNPVTVSSNSEIRDIDFQLEYGLAITGVVARATDGMGILGIKVLAYNANLELVGTGITDAGGAYVIPQLVPGNYFLQTQNTFGFKDKFCENAKTQETATKVNLNEGIRTINFTLESTLDDFYDQMLDDMNKD